MRRALLVLALALLPAAAAAHTEPYSYIDLTLTPTAIQGHVVAHVEDLRHEANLASRDSLFDPAFVQSHLELLRGVLSARLKVVANGDTLRPQWGGFAIVPERRSVGFDVTLPLAKPAGEVELVGPLFLYDPPHETYLNIYDGGALKHQDLLDRGHKVAVYFSGSRQGTWAVIRTFVAQGIHHIFIGPDHILFIVGLLLLGGSIGKLLKIVTGFTIAHSITLALATLQILNPSPRIIEPAIALSIVYVGVESLLASRHQRDWRVVIAFCFGFVHGFGFASVLREFGLPSGALGWSLASFNVGVEIGQMCIVLAVAPALAAIRAWKPAIAQRVVVWGACFIIVAGGYWFVQRVFFSV